MKLMHEGMCAVTLRKLLEIAACCISKLNNHLLNAVNISGVDANVRIESLS